MALPSSLDNPEVPRQEDTSGLDIYAVLGVTPDVMPLLAQKLYWLKVEQQRLTPDELETARRLTELNEALATVLDSDRRAAYDRHHRKPVGIAPAVDSYRRRRVGAALGLMLLTVAATLFAAFKAGPFLLAVTVTVGMLAVVAVVTWPRRGWTKAARPFASLQLTTDAGRTEVDLAYETLGHEFLRRLKSDTKAIARLERLDLAYTDAVRIIAARGGGTPAVRRHVVLRAAHRVARALWVALSALVNLLGAAALAVLLWLARAGAWLTLSAGGNLRFNADRLSALVKNLREESGPDQSEVSIDVSRRLAVGPRTDTLAGDLRDSAKTPHPAQVEAPAALERIEAYLVLESAVGRRRVPIQTVPISIGSHPNCELVLSADLGIAPQHALIWQRDGVILIHVIAPRAAACLVNDFPMTWASLEDGDVILLGDARFLIETRGHS